MIELNGVAKTFEGSIHALQDVTFSVPTGSVCALLGHNGAGKTTAINILSTLLRPTSGKAIVAGYDVVDQPGGNWRAIADQPTRLRRAKFSTRSAAVATLSAGLVIRVAISRALVAYRGAKMVRRSATSVCSVVAENRRAVPTFSRLTAAPHIT